MVILFNIIFFMANVVVKNRIFKKTFGFFNFWGWGRCGVSPLEGVAEDTAGRWFEIASLRSQ